jgi:Fe2+ transport system protein FeoA
MMRFGWPLKWRKRCRKHQHATRCSSASCDRAGKCLSDVPTGEVVEICGFSPQLSPDRKAHLQAYGLTTGYPVRILQTSPVIIIQVENLELALERELAAKIHVTDIEEVPA